MEMNNINIAVLDRQHRFASELGKLGTKTDIAMYHYKIMDKIITFIDPVSYPDRVKSLSKTIGLSDFIMINIDKLDKITGEIILVSSYSSLPGVVYSELFSRSDLIPFIKGTGLEKWRFASSKDELLELLQKISFNEFHESADHSIDGTAILIDQIFQVKSVGTVALGTVRRGVVKVHDNLIFLPNNIKSDIRSIQVHDKDVKEASNNSRVGLALKQPLSKVEGSLLALSDMNGYSITDRIMVRFTLSTLVKKKLEQGQSIFIGYDLVFVNGKINRLEYITDGNESLVSGEMELVLDKKVYFKPNKKVLFYDVNTSPRIIGYGYMMV
ncbi:hypothetical protein J7J26_00715 [Candidatus Micrarchaeota archaeon]|nr:hypothetical protein [Candidatus Micrarchaeota archaeon]